MNSSTKIPNDDRVSLLYFTDKKAKLQKDAMTSVEIACLLRPSFQNTITNTEKAFYSRTHRHVPSCRTKHLPGGTSIQYLTVLLTRV